MENEFPTEEPPEVATPDTIATGMEDDFKEYLKDLDLQPEDLRGKKLVDVGSGGAGSFVRSAKKAGADAVGVDIGTYKRIPGLEDIPFVQADGEHLPFSDGTFDLVVSYCAIPRVIDPGFLEGSEEELADSAMRQEAMRAGIAEMVRVARLGGEIRFGPIVRDPELGRDRFLRLRDTIIRKAVEAFKGSPDLVVREVLIRGGSDVCVIITKK